jgi:small subunit ribosomal protein S11
MAEDTTTTTPVTEAPVTTEAPAAAPKRKKSKRSVPFGQVHILASFNNTIITVTDQKGGALTYSSAGACGFRGSKKGTAYAAQVAAEKALSEAKQAHGLSKADVFVRGIGLGRDTAIRALAAVGIAMEGLHDVTGVPHGGVRPRKAKRN